MLRHFEDEAVAVVIGFKRRKDRGKGAGEADVDDSADNLRNAAGCASDVQLGRAACLAAGAFVAGALAAAFGAAFAAAGFAAALGAAALGAAFAAVFFGAVAMSVFLAFCKS